MSTQTVRRPVIEAKQALLVAIGNYLAATGEKTVPYRDWPDLCAVLDNPFNDFKDVHIARALKVLEEDCKIECEALEAGDGFAITLLIKP